MYDKKMIINGFTFHIIDGPVKSYEARRGDVVLTAKNLRYLITKVKKYSN